jgi:hypothetical protein
MYRVGLSPSEQAQQISWDLSPYTGKVAQLTLHKSDGWIALLAPSKAAPTVEFGADESAPLTYARKQIDQETHAVSDDLDRLAASQLSFFGRGCGIPPEDLQNPKIGNHGTWLVALTDKWVYHVDVSGNQTLRPISNLPQVLPGLGHEGMPEPSSVRAASLLKTTKELRSALGLDQQGNLTQTTVKQELIFLNRPGGSVKTFGGRYLVRLSDADNNQYLEVIFDSDYKPMRVDTTLLSSDAKRLSAALMRAFRRSGAAVPLREESAPFSLATFFDPSEYRFEVDASAFEGAPFLDPALTQNPFQHDNFDDATSNLLVNGHFSATGRTDFVDVESWMRTQDFKFWQFEFWSRCGHVGGARGNWDRLKNSWQRPDVQVFHHPLKDYRLIGGEPSELKTFTLSDNRDYQFPTATSKQLETKFRSDLEQCTVGVFLTHGGPLSDVLQLRRGLDVWFIPGSQQIKFGTGKLRHLFFNSCGAMESFKGKEEGNRYLTLFKEWIPARFVQGLRTACGMDGNADTSGQSGWRFFGPYNQGNSISDAWRRSAINESRTNAPVTVSYGATPIEALSTLLDGRFASERVEPLWSSSSVWRDIRP